MYPVLYKADETVFTHNGLGRLSDSLKCLVSEERNGPYELEMEYPLTGIHFSDLKEGMLLKAKPNDTSNLQIFRIYNIEKKFNKRVGIYAEHISYDLNDYPVDIVRRKVNYSGGAGGLTPQEQWDMLIVNGAIPTVPRFSLLSVDDFSFVSDISSVALPIYVETPCSIRGLLGGQEDSFLNLYRGEFEFDNYNVIFHDNRGKDNGVTVKYGKNMTDMEMDLSIEGMYTHVFPYAKKTTYPVADNDGNTAATPIETYIFADDIDHREGDPQDPQNHPGRLIELKTTITEGGISREVPLSEIYGFTKIKYLDLTGVFESDYDIQEADVFEQANNYISENNEIKRPKVTLTVNFQPLHDVVSIGVHSLLEKVSLCDTVRVVHPLYGIDEKLKVNKTVYNVLIERYKTVEIGDPKSNFADTVKDQYFS